MIFGIISLGLRKNDKIDAHQRVVKLTPFRMSCGRKHLLGLSSRAHPPACKTMQEMQKAELARTAQQHKFCKRKEWRNHRINTFRITNKVVLLSQCLEMNPVRYEALEVTKDLDPRGIFILDHDQDLDPNFFTQRDFFTQEKI